MVADILDWGSISGLGVTSGEISATFTAGNSILKTVTIGGRELPVAALSSDAVHALDHFLAQHPTFIRQDRVVQLAAFCAEKMIQGTGPLQDPENTLVTIGSSRGATHLMEQRFRDFLEDNIVSPLTSPTTTLGNISAAVAALIQADGPVLSHSMTCSTFIQAVGNAVAWLGSGMCTEAWAGASESCLTPFTVAQFRALRILSQQKTAPFCTPGPIGEARGMALGEGAIVVRLSMPGTSRATFAITGLGFAGEPTPSLTGATMEGTALHSAMLRCMESSGKQPEIIIAHMPGTRQGDLAEWNAIQRIFPKNPPGIIPIKWFTGHWLGAAAGSSMLLALHLLQGGHLPDTPYYTGMPGWQSVVPKNIMINALGFGGQAACMMISCKD